jgi:hypothetical protein
MSLFPQTDPESQHNSIKILAEFFVEMDKWILKFTWKCKGPEIAKMILNILKFPISKLTAKLQQ